jgi:uncharacterized metal-binding protein YceD (DUF177 family)
MKTEQWSVTVRVDQVPETGRHVALAASEADRAAVAKAAEVDAVEALSAAFDLTRRGREGLRATGTVRGTVRQTCVVSLEPLVNTVEEAIDVTFAPHEAEAGLEPDAVLAVQGEDPPEPLVNGSIDLGALATEFLILGIDPYPRKPGVAFTPPPAEDDSAGHPFAALAALKKASKVKD